MQINLLNHGCTRNVSICEAQKRFTANRTTTSLSVVIGLGIVRAWRLD